MIDCREAVRRMWAYLELELATKPLARVRKPPRDVSALLWRARVQPAHAGNGRREGCRPGMPPELRSRIDFLLGDPEASPEGSV